MEKSVSPRRTTCRADAGRCDAVAAGRPTSSTSGMSGKIVDPANSAAGGGDAGGATHPAATTATHAPAAR